MDYYESELPENTEKAKESLNSDNPWEAAEDICNFIVNEIQARFKTPGEKGLHEEVGDALHSDASELQQMDEDDEGPDLSASKTG